MMDILVVCFVCFPLHLMLIMLRTTNFIFFSFSNILYFKMG
jgi:hypothetical protein